MLKPEKIEEMENLYLDEFYYFLKFARRRLLEGFNTKNKIKKYWDKKWDPDEGHISNFSTGAERIVYSFFNAHLDFGITSLFILRSQCEHSGMANSIYLSSIAPAISQYFKIEIIRKCLWIADSLMDNLRKPLDEFQSLLQEVSLGLSQLFTLMLVSYVIVFNSISITCLSYLESNFNIFLSFFQSLGFGMLPELLSFLNQCPAVMNIQINHLFVEFHIHVYFSNILDNHK